MYNIVEKNWQAINMRGAVVLAGGRANRMGGNKELSQLCGRPLIAYAVEKALKVADEVVVVLRRGVDEERYVKVLPKAVKLTRDAVDSVAPVVGIMAGMAALSSAYASVLPCDSPFVKINMLNLLFQEAEGFDAAIPRWPNGMIEPLHAVYEVKSTLKAAREAYAAGEFRNLSTINRLNSIKYVSTERIREVDPQLISFFNINTLHDLHKAEQILSKL